MTMGNASSSTPVSAPAFLSINKSGLISYGYVKPSVESTIDHGRLIVHGHTPLRDGRPDMRSNRINLDTGAVYGRPLTAAVFVETTAQPCRHSTNAFAHSVRATQRMTRRPCEYLKERFVSAAPILLNLAPLDSSNSSAPSRRSGPQATPPMGWFNR